MRRRYYEGGNLGGLDFARFGAKEGKVKASAISNWVNIDIKSR